jgi:hypothetical protein
MCSLTPKYHCLPFLVWRISGSRCFSRFLAELGADDRGIDDHASFDRHPGTLQRPPYFGKHLLCQSVSLQQMAKLEQGGGIRHRFTSQPIPTNRRRLALSYSASSQARSARLNMY